MSCEDQLEEEVFSSFTADNFYQDVASSELGMYGIYDVLGSINTYGENYLFYFNESTDERRHWRQGRGFDADVLANFQHSEINKNINRLWAEFYKGVARANQVIDRVTILRDKLANRGSLTSEQNTSLNGYNNVLGDAHFLRGFLYFQLVKNWGDVPLRLNSVISVDDAKIERSPQLEVYKQIEKDILIAIPLLPEASKVKSLDRICKGAARGILARFYLKWAGFPLRDISKFEKAAEHTYAIINSGEHALNTVIEPTGIGVPFDSPFPQVFKNLADKIFDLKESMFEIHFSRAAGITSSDDSRIGSWYGVLTHQNSIYNRGAPRAYALPTFYESFDSQDNLRRDWSVAAFKINNNSEFVPVNDPRTYGIGKFRRYLMNPISEDRNDEGMNWPVLRYADVLLMFAESINETLENGGTLPAGTNINMAYDAINQVKRRARALDINTSDVGIDLVGGSGDDFRQAIRQERSWELCFEGVRRNDLIRWGVYIETVRQTGVDLTSLNPLNFITSRDYFPAATIQAHNVLHPIPLIEISQNPDVLNTDPSNNGYR